MVRRGSLRQLMGALVATLVGSTALGFWIVDDADAVVPACERHRIEAAERARTVTGEGERVVVIGDSWSVGLGLADLADSWPSRLEGEVHVAGFSGSGFSARASGCGQVSFADRARAVVQDPDVVVVAGGLNDVDQSDTAIASGFTRLMEVLDEQRVVIIGPASAPRRAAGVPRVDALLRQLSREHAVPYVATDDLELDYLPDRLHLTDAGHADFGDAVAAALAGLTPARPSQPPHSASQLANASKE